MVDEDEIHAAVSANPAICHEFYWGKRRPVTPGLDLEPREGVRQELWVMLNHICKITVDRLGRGLHPSFGGHLHPAHSPLNIWRDRNVYQIVQGS